MKLHNIVFLSGLVTGAWLGAVETTPVQNPAAPRAVPPVKDTQALPTMDTESRIVLRSISERYQKLSRWEAKFKQETFSVGLGKGTYNEGRFVFMAPNRFRYSIMQPENSDFISNGKSAWYVNYREGRGKAAYVRHFAQLNDSDIDRYLILLRGIEAKNSAQEKKLLADFIITGKSVTGELTLTLQPRRSVDVAKVELSFRNDEIAPFRARITDVIGNTTTISVTSWQKLSVVNEKEFVPDYPKNSTVETL